MFEETAQISVFHPYHIQFEKDCKRVVKLTEIWEGAGFSAYQMTNEQKKVRAFEIRDKIYDHDKRTSRIR